MSSLASMPTPPRAFAPLGSSTPDSAAAPPEIRIRPPAGWYHLNLGDLWNYRELLVFLVWRDLQVRYKQTMLGAAWALLQPITMLMVFSLVLGRLAGLAAHTGEVPYSAVVFVGLVPWIFFANAITTAGQSVVGSQNLVTKVFFPRLIIPMAAVGAGWVDLLLGGAVVGLYLLWLGITPNVGWLALPVLLAILTLAALGVGALFSALTVAYRDVRFIIPFLVQVGMFLSPVVYPSTLVPGPWRCILALNPMVGLIDGLRAACFGGWDAMTLATLGISTVTSLILAFVGAAYFRQVETRFADIL